MGSVRRRCFRATGAGTVAAPPWPSSPRPSSPSLPPVRREKRERLVLKKQEGACFSRTSCSPLSRQAGGRLGERGWGSEGLEAADRGPSTRWFGVTIRARGGPHFRDTLS